MDISQEDVAWTERSGGGHGVGNKEERTTSSRMDGQRKESKWSRHANTDQSLDRDKDGMA